MNKDEIGRACVLLMVGGKKCFQNFVRKSCMHDMSHLSRAPDSFP
jgi:hypothetical protein